MGRRPRFVKPSTMFEITARTVEGRRLFRPVPALTAAVLSVLGRSLALFAVELHAFIYLSNHLHLLGTFLDGALMQRFMRHLNRNTALAAKAITGWTGDVWCRYSPIPVLDDRAADRRLRYVMSNGVKEGLVAHPLEWPGPSSAHAFLSGEPISTEWIHRPPRGPAVIDTNRIALAPLPGWTGWPQEERTRRARDLLDGIADQARGERQGRPVLGVQALRSLDPFEPTSLDARPAPIAHASSRTLVDAYGRELKSFVTAHRQAGDEQNRSRRPAAYPPFGFPAAVPYRDGKE